MTWAAIVAALAGTVSSTVAFLYFLKKYSDVADKAMTATKDAATFESKHAVLSRDHATLQATLAAKEDELARERAARAQVDKDRQSLVERLAALRDPDAISLALNSELDRLRPALPPVPEVPAAPTPSHR